MTEMPYQPQTRRPAKAGQLVIDPAAWRAEDFREAPPWVLRLSDDEAADILEATARVEAAGLDLTEITREDFTLGAAGEVLARIFRELTEGVGIVQLRGLPVARLDKRQAAIAFIGIGAHFGRLSSQNAEGHLLGHVKDLGKDYADPMARGYQTAAAMGFHTDPCDFVALMCLKTARAGGQSRVVSSPALYNEMMARRPDLAEELTKDFYFSRHGEVPPGEKPYYKMPVLAFVDGYFFCRGASAHVRKAQGLPGVPPFTQAQKDAIDMFQSLADELAVDIPFEEGDFQILCNHVMLHSRRAFEDWPEQAEKRHLFRLWIQNPGIRPIPDLVREGYKGIEVAGFKPSAPLEAEIEAV
ncbi:MAG TPA: TauD/TfdA family dioxygenase [Alphaproteobacteria bacterium]|nr:TauD/TfdA family dioxygenase [Alphaproteobacteria bacterium]